MHAVILSVHESSNNPIHIPIRVIQFLILSSVLDSFPSPLMGEGEGGGEKVLCFQSFIPLPLAPSRQGLQG
jgi:hypothetical protein